MKIFLTGMSGYLGSVLAASLAKLPGVENITGIDITAPKETLPENVKFTQMDIRSPELSNLTAGHDTIIHTAMIVLWPKRIPASVRDDINLNGIRNVAQAAVTKHVERFIHISSVAAYDPIRVVNQSNVAEDFPLGKGDSFFYYSNGKALAEKTLGEVLKESGVKLAILRPTFVIGPKNRDTVPSLRKTSVKIQGRDPSVQYIHEDDVSEALQLALQTNLTGAYNVVPDDTIPLSEVSQIIGVERAPVVPFWLAHWIAAVQWHFFGSLVHSSWLDANYSNSSFSNAKLRATGWQPQYTSREALISAVK